MKGKGKLNFLKIVDNISKLANIYYVRQKTIRVGGCAEAFIGDEPFVVVLGDDVYLH